MAEGNPVPRQTLNFTNLYQSHSAELQLTGRSGAKGLQDTQLLQGFLLDLTENRSAFFFIQWEMWLMAFLTTLGVDEEATNLNDIISAFNNHFDARKTS